MRAREPAEQAHDEQPEPPRGAPTGAERILELQRQAGNAAVTRALGRQEAARTPEQLAALAEDITEAIAEKETRRRAVESTMRTSAGVRASYASQVQATTGWTITALLALDDARLATFGLTRAELRDAEARARAAGELWDAVMASDGAEFAPGPRLAAAGLEQADLERMLLFRDLRNDLERRLKDELPRRTAELEAMADADVWALATSAERATAGARTAGRMTEARRRRLAPMIARREQLAAVAAGAPATTLGIPLSTISAYRPRGGGRNYAEDKAAWQRVAAEREPAGERIADAATDDGGLRLGRARIARINEQYLRAHPAATDDEICDNAARRHNPGNPLTATVREHFQAIRARRGGP